MRFRRFLRVPLIIGLLSLTPLVAAGCGGDDDASTAASGKGGSETIKIGYVTALTGWLAEFEDTFVNSIKMRFDQINEAGGLAGKYKVDLTIIDGKSDPAQGAIAAEQLADSSIMFGPCDQDVGLPAAQSAAENGIPFISSCAGASEFTEIVEPWVYLSVPGAWADGSGMSEWALDKGYDTAYLLSSNDIAYLQSVGDAFKAQYAKNGGELVGETTYKMGQPRYTTEIDKIANVSPAPEFIAASVITPDSIVMLREMANRGMDIPIMFPFGNQTSLILQPKEALAKLDAYVLGLSPIPEKGSDIAEYFADYREEYGEDPSPSQAAVAADDVAVIDDAVERAGSTDPQAIQDALQETVDVEGMTGPVTYKGQNGRPKKDYTVVKLTPEGFEFTKTFFPTDLFSR